MFLILYFLLFVTSNSKHCNDDINNELSMQKYENFTKYFINYNPDISNIFFHKTSSPIFILYDSNISSQISFLKSWFNLINNNQTNLMYKLRVSLLNCQKFPSECLKWSNQINYSTPCALIFSSKTNNFAIINSTLDVTNNQINILLSKLNKMPIKFLPFAHLNQKKIIKNISNISYNNENQIAIKELITGKSGETSSYEFNGNTLKISGSGMMFNFTGSNVNVPWGNYKSNITTLIVGEGITTIGAISFFNCKNLVTVS